MTSRNDGPRTSTSVGCATGDFVGCATGDFVGGRPAGVDEERRGGRRGIIRLVELRIGSNPAESAAERIAARLRDAVRRRGEATLALSGGSTAPPMIDALLARPVPWEAVTVFQVDERVAPPGHDARNALQLTGLAAAATVQFMPVNAPDVDAAAGRYAELLPDRIDVVHLGLGDDGHTASWPPGRDGVRDADHDVVALGEFHGWPRMTMTRRVVNGARCRVVLAMGSGKRPMVSRWLAGDRTLPIAAVRRTDTWVFLDHAAAPEAPIGVDRS